MNLDAIRADVLYLLDNVRNTPDVAVGRWSTIICDDGALPIGRVLRYLLEMDQGLGLKVNDTATQKITVDIVKNSALHQVLFYNEPRARFCSETPLEMTSEPSSAF